MTLAEHLPNIVDRLQRAGVPSPQADAESLCAHVLGISRGELLAKLHLGGSLSESQTETLENLVQRRVSREPLQHLMGIAPFMAFEVSVGPGVFVPRPETEVLAERAIATASSMGVGDNGLRVVDLCSGSGVLAIAIQRTVPHATVEAWEVSDEALPYLSRNVEVLAPGVAIRQASLSQWASEVLPHSVDLIVANPPYVPNDETPNDPEVQHFDPPLALYGGEDGLDLIREIVGGASSALRPGGVLMLEHSNVQGAEVRSLFEAHHFRSVLTERDLVGRDRFTQGYQP